MTAVPTVARWWRNRSDPQRLDLYTRWSFYTWIGATPLFALLAVGATPGVGRHELPFLSGAVLVAGSGIALTRAGFAAARVDGALPGRLVAVSAGAALVTAAAGVLALWGEADPVATAWNVELPFAMVLTACSPVWDSPRLVRVAAGIGVLAGLAALVAGEPLPGAVLMATVFGAVVASIALGFRFSVWVLAVVVEMERTRGVQAQLAVAEERLRFARDLHDVMGRNLSAIAVKGQLAAELVRRDLPEAADEVEDISRIAEESLREVRGVVGGYRSVSLAGELAGARSVLRAAGVACTVRGEEDGGTLAQPVQTALGWVVREAVTNVLRHSTAASCTVELRTSEGEAELRVTNDGVTGTPGGWGSGLTGLAERLAATGGRLSARAHEDRFVLTATVPMGVPA